MSWYRRGNRLPAPKKITYGECPYFEHEGKLYDKVTYKEVKVKKYTWSDFKKEVDQMTTAKIRAANPEPSPADKDETND